MRGNEELKGLIIRVNQPFEAAKAPILSSVQMQDRHSVELMLFQALNPSLLHLRRCRLLLYYKMQHISHYYRQCG